VPWNCWALDDADGFAALGVHSFHHSLKHWTRYAKSRINFPPSDNFDFLNN
jgi:hypothetical protein